MSLTRVYPEASPQSRAVTTGQLWAFRSSIAVGDVRYLMPLVTQPGLIALGRCTGIYGYDPEELSSRTTLPAGRVAAEPLLAEERFSRISWPNS